jgi:enoyl-CoA hydratase/carnithine racemase
MGLVNRVVPAADFPKALEETVERFLALPPTSALASRRLLNRAFDVEFDAFRRQMEASLKACLTSAEHRTAMEKIRTRRRC